MHERARNLRKDIFIWFTAAALAASSGMALNEAEKFRTGFETLPSSIKDFIGQSTPIGGSYFTGVSHTDNSSEYTVLRMRFVNSGGTKGEPGIEVIRYIFDGDDKGENLSSLPEFYPVNNLQEGISFIESSPYNFGNIIAFSPPVPKLQRH